MSATPPHQRPGGRNASPARRLHARPLTVLLWFVWLGGVVLGVVVPALLSPPQASGRGNIVGALSCSFAGILVMAFVGFVLYARTREVGVLLLTVVPSAVVLIAAGGLMGTKLFA